MGKRDLQRRIDTGLATYHSGGIVASAAGGGGTGGGTTAHSYSLHTDTIPDAHAPQFLKLDGTRAMTGGLNMGAQNITNVGTVDGIDVSVLAGRKVLGGHGLVTGGGTIYAGDTTVDIELATVSGLSFDGSDKLQLDDAVAGNGLSITNKVLAVATARGLEIASDAVRVDEDFAFAWTADHAWGGTDVVISPTYNTVSINWGSAPNGTSSAGLRVKAPSTTDPTVYIKQIASQTSELWRVEDTGGNALIVLTQAGDLESGNPAFTSGRVGWQISATGNAEFNNIVARGELHASIFVADEMSAGGGTIVVQEASKVGDPISGTDNTLPALNGSFTLVVQASWDTGLCYVSDDDILRLKFMGPLAAGAGLDLWDVFVEVSGAPVFNNNRDLADGKPGTFDVPCILRKGGATGVVIPTGVAAILWARALASGYTGHMILTADQSYSPYLDIATVANKTGTWGGIEPVVTPRVRVGNLDGVLGLTEQWGIAAGTDLSANNTASQYFVASDLQFKLQNINISLYSSGANSVSIEADGDVKFGTNVGLAASTTFDFVASTGALRVGPGSGGASLHWTGSAVELRNSAGSAAITLNSSGDSQFTGVMTIATAGEIRQGTVTSGNVRDAWPLTGFTGLRVWNDTGVGRIAGYKANTLQWSASTTGTLTAGASAVQLGASGMDILSNTSLTPAITANERAVSWWGSFTDIGTGEPHARVYGAYASSNAYLKMEANNPTAATATPKLYLMHDAVNYPNRALYAEDLDNILLTAANGWVQIYGGGVSKTELYHTARIVLDAPEVQSKTLLPFDTDNASPWDMNHDVGAVGRRWRKGYFHDFDVANNLTVAGNVTVTGTISGTIGGAIWAHTTQDMRIQSSWTGAGDPTLYVEGTGTGEAMNLNVEGNITTGGTLFAQTISVTGLVDGVDVSTLGTNYTNHAGDTSIHHARKHSITSTSDHEETGLTSGHVLRATGATTFAFGAITSSIITDFVEAAQDAVGGIVTDGTTIDFTYTDNGASAGTIAAEVKAGSIANSYLANMAQSTVKGRITTGTGAPEDLTVANLYTMLNADNDTSTDGVGVEALVKAVSGVTKLKGLEVTDGGLSVTGVGEFNVGTLFTVDTSLGALAIGKTPDSQFALDVNGALRASYLVGPHAIQLDDAGLIAHFDGDLTGLEGEWNGHMGQKGVPTGAVGFLPGKFGKALATGEAHTNYVLNPSFEVDAANWTAGNAVAGSQQDTTRAFVGVASYKLMPSNAAGNSYILNDSLMATVANGATVWAQCRVWRTDPFKSASIGIRVSGATQASVLTPTDGTVGGSQWEWLYTSWTNDTGSAKTVGILCANGAADSTTAVWFDAVQLEADSMTPYFDGAMLGFDNAGDPSLSATYTTQWSGTPHASTSVRPNLSSVEYAMPATGLNTASGAVMFWMYRYGPNSVGGQGQFLFYGGSSAGNFDVLISAAEVLSFRFGGSRSIEVNWNAAWNLTWKHVAITWHKGYTRLYVDGVLTGTGVGASYTAVSGDEDGVPMSAPLSLYGDCVVTYPSTGYRYNGLIDDFVVSKKRLTGKQIQAIVASNAPVFAESSSFSFRATPKGLIWADAEGLWMRDSAGSAVLGVYGGAATKSWGGSTLSAGDVKIGGTTNYLLWDNDAATLAVSGQINVLAGSSGYGNMADAPFKYVFVEDFTANVLTNWTLVNASTGERSVVTGQAGAIMGGNALQLGNNNATVVDTAWVAHTGAGGLIPFDATKVYRMTVRARRTAGTGVFYAGFAGVASDGTTMVNMSGANSYSSQHYVVASNWGAFPDTSTWVTFTGYVWGTAASGSTAPVLTPPFASMHSSTAYIRPLIIANYGVTTGTMQVESVSVEVASAWNALEGNPSRYGTPAASGLYLNNSNMGYYDASAKAWKVYISSTGTMQLGNDPANGAGLKWDGSALNINGSLVVGSSNKLWLNEGGNADLAIGGTVKASAPFRVTAAGALTATSGAIGGWTINSTTGLSANNISLLAGDIGTARVEVGASTYKAGIVSIDSISDVAIFVGGSTPDTASFRVAGGSVTSVSLTTNDITTQTIASSYADDHVILNGRLRVNDTPTSTFASIHSSSAYNTGINFSGSGDNAEVQIQIGGDVAFNDAADRVGTRFTRYGMYAGNAAVGMPTGANSTGAYFGHKDNWSYLQAAMVHVNDGSLYLQAGNTGGTVTDSKPIVFRLHNGSGQQEKMRIDRLTGVTIFPDIAFTLKRGTSHPATDGMQQGDCMIYMYNYKMVIAFLRQNSAGMYYYYFPLAAGAETPLKYHGVSTTGL